MQWCQVAIAMNVMLLCYWSCPLVCLDVFLVVLTSSLELCFRLISPVDYPCLYRLVVYKSCDLCFPRCGLRSPHFPKNSQTKGHHFPNMGDKPQNGHHVARESTLFMWTPRIVYIFMWTALGLHCFGPLVVHVWFFGPHFKRTWTYCW